MKLQSKNIKDLLKEAAAFLAEKNIPNPALDAEVLLSFVLNIDRAKLFMNLNDNTDGKAVEKYEKLLNRRSAFEPVAYIRNKKEFYSLEFFVDERVLIPRPETEHLVETAIGILKNYVKLENKRIVDLGTGSGAIPITLLKNCRDLSFIYASDISEKALEVAKQNAITHGISKKIKFIHSNLFESIEGKFDLIISNPPYIKSCDIDSLEKDVRAYEPRLALDGGREGFDTVFKIIEESYEKLNDKGDLLLEIGHNQEDIVKSYEACNRYGEMRFYEDHSGKKRVLRLSR